MARGASWMVSASLDSPRGTPYPWDTQWPKLLSPAAERAASEPGGSMVQTALSGGDGSGRLSARLTRRHFLRGVTSVALGASAAGLLAACAPQAPAAPSGQQA